MLVWRWARRNHRRRVLLHHFILMLLSVKMTLFQAPLSQFPCLGSEDLFDVPHVPLPLCKEAYICRHEVWNSYIRSLTKASVSSSGLNGFSRWGVVSRHVLTLLPTWTLALLYHPSSQRLWNPPPNVRCALCVHKISGLSRECLPSWSPTVLHSQSAALYRLERKSLRTHLATNIATLNNF